MPRPVCPVDPLQKAWIEYRMQWLSSVFGVERLSQASFLTPESLGFKQVTADNFVSFFERLHRQAFPEKTPFTICLDDAYHQAELQLADDHESPQIPRTIHLPEFSSKPVSRQAANVVVEICHRRLLECGQLDEDSHSELLAELASVFFGLAFYPTNECVGRGATTGSTVETLVVPVKQTHMTGRMFGYAIALWIDVRNEQVFRWQRSLRLDVREAAEQSLRYLERNNDSFFSEENLGNNPDHLTQGQISQLIDDPSPSKVIIGLWQMGRHHWLSRIGTDRVVKLLEHEVPEIRWTAAQALALADDGTPAMIEALVKSLSDRVDQVRANAATALGFLAKPGEQVVRQVSHLLKDADRSVACSAAWTLGRFGSSALPAKSLLVRLLRQSLVECDHWSIDLLVGALDQIVDQFEDLVSDIAKPDEYEMRELLFQALKDHRAAQYEPPESA